MIAMLAEVAIEQHYMGQHFPLVLNMDQFCPSSRLVKLRSILLRRAISTIQSFFPIL